MPSSAITRLVPISRLRLALAGLITLACGIGIAVMAMDVVDKINSAASASTDNVQWTLGQVEVEMMRLVYAVDNAQNHPDNLPEVRRRFDVFYNRLNILGHGSVFASLRQNAEFKERFSRVDAFMLKTAPLIDASDPALQLSLPQISTELQAVSGEARLIALLGVQIFGNTTDRRRAGLEHTLVTVGVLTVLLVATLLGLLVMLLRLHRNNRSAASRNLETLSRLDAVVATALDAVVTVDGAGRIVDFNAAASYTFGFARSEAVGSLMAGLLLPGINDQSLFGPEQIPLLSGQGRMRITAMHRTGKMFPAEIAVTKSAANGGLLYVAFLRDLSTQVAAEQALVRARDDALAGEKAKADLLVVMSHEIRTPLNGMIGTIELLHTTELQAHQREYLRIMEASGKLLMHHVNDVLDIARLDSGKTPLSLAPVDLRALVAEVFDNQTSAAQASGNTLTLNASTNGRDLVIGDAAQLRQILLNLIGNAVKFTQNGEITVEIDRLGEGGATEIKVSDTGMGIAKPDLERIFDDFVTLDASYSRRAAGTGLGLGIVKRIVAGMAGTLRVESEYGHGSVFCVTLPLRVMERSDAIPDAVPAMSGATPPPGTVSCGANWVTLVVEDNYFNRLIVRDMLVKEGHTVVEARDGAEGIARAAGRRFDLILMDISMPHTDGLQAAQAIRAGRGASRSTPIVALTAHALQSEVDRFLESGMQHVLVKPITIDTLRTTIAAAMRDSTSPVADAALVDTPLLNPSILRQMAQDLGLSRVESLLARFLIETEAGLQTLLRNVATMHPDTILRDVHRMEGAAGMFGATALHAALSQIELLFKAGDKSAASALVPDLDALWRDTRAAYGEGALPQLSSLR